MAVRRAGWVVSLAALALGGASVGSAAQTSELNYSVQAGTAQDVTRLTGAPAGVTFELPDLSPYTPETVRYQSVDKPRARVRVNSMLTEQSFAAFTGQSGRLREWVQRQATLPKVISIDAGYITPRQLARTLPKEMFEETERGVFIARLPIAVRPGATLHIAEDVHDMRLSLERGAFLVNQGHLFVTGSRIRAWSETKRQPAWFEKRDKFRPFVVAWSGSHTSIVNSTLAHLGFDAPKSFGVTLSDGGLPSGRMSQQSLPTAQLIGSELYDNWYGFYSSGAQDVVLRGNHVHDNIQGGIAVRERARQVLIAENRVSKTKLKHGVVVSSDSAERWIFDNEVFENAGSGIAVEGGADSVVARNQVVRNANDGLTVYESDHAALWGNLVAYNQHHGIRVRSSEVVLRDNLVLGNARAGIYGYAAVSDDAAGKLGRRASQPQGSLTIVGGQLIDNGLSPIELAPPLSLELYAVDMHQPDHARGIALAGVLGPYQVQVLDILMRRKLPVVMRPSAPNAEGPRDE